MGVKGVKGSQRELKDVCFDYEIWDEKTIVFNSFQLLELLELP